jgi:hypothetical protein
MAASPSEAFCSDVRPDGVPGLPVEELKAAVCSVEYDNTIDE